jgi:hypothetical protein
LLLRSSEKGAAAGQRQDDVDLPIRRFCRGQAAGKRGGNNKRGGNEKSADAQRPSLKMN